MGLLNNRLNTHSQMSRSRPAPGGTPQSSHFRLSILRSEDFSDWVFFVLSRYRDCCSGGQPQEIIAI